MKAVFVVVVLLLLKITLTATHTCAEVAEDRARLIVGQRWVQPVACQGKALTLEFTIYNAGPVEASDISVVLPPAVATVVDSGGAIALASISPGSRVVRTLTLTPSKTANIPQAQAAAKVTYRSASAPTREIVGYALPMADFVVLSPAEFATKDSKHYLEWVGWVVIQLAGIGYPASKYFGTLKRKFFSDAATEVNKSKRR